MILDIKKLGQSKSFKAIIVAILILAIASAIFQAGVFVGFSKASFLGKSGDNFYKVFGERGSQNGSGYGMGMMGGFRDEFTGGHGAVGRIVKVSLPTIVVIGPDNIEKTIITSNSTDIRQFRDTISLDKLAVDQFITVLGTPNDEGQIEAKFIRVLPPPAQAMMGIVASTTNSK